MFGQEENQQPTHEQTTKIGPEVLSVLNLTQEDVEQSNRQRLERERQLAQFRERGKNYYRGLKEGSHQSEYINTFKINASPSLHKLPDDSVTRWQQEKAETHPSKHESTQAGLMAFLEGYGEAALDARDWQTSINVFDITTEGGIMQNPNVLEKLKAIAQEDKTVGVEIAQAIQERINRRKENQPSQTPPQPTSEPGLRPAPLPTLDESLTPK